MSEVGNAGAQASVPEVVADDKTAVAAVETPKVEATEETAEAEMTEKPVEGAEVVETEEEKKTKSKLRREKQQAREKALVDENKRLSEHLAAVTRNAPVIEDAGSEPDPTNYDSDAKYTADLAVWKIRKEFSENRTKAHKETTANLRNDSVAAQNELFFERARALEDTHPGIEKIIRSDDIPISPVMRDVLVESEKGPEVAFYLSANREEAKRIFDLSKTSPLSAAKELGRLEVKLSLPKPRTETKAPPPPSTVSGTVKGPSKNPETMPQAEYVAWRKNGGGEKRTG